jgi:superfamily II DNA or RNA helicase
MQIAWANALNVPTIILAPLCVAEQTVGEAAKLGVEVHYATEQSQVRGRITITNYERLAKFDPTQFEAVVLDESSILKAFDGQTRTALIEAFKHTTYRLCCTATPSPNDVTELANHAEFLGLMTRPEFLATWFIRVDAGHRTTTHHGWRMKRHAVQPFYRWLSSWAVALSSPADLGYDAAGFTLPPLRIHETTLLGDYPTGDALFPEMGMHGLSGRLAARRTVLADRVDAIKRLVVAGRDSWLLWCGLNEESTALAAAIPGAVNVQGSDTYAEKVGAVQSFVGGETRVLVSKPKILGFGMNFQHCSQMAFVGLSDSYEAYYQCIRRAWRYGQKRPVDVHIVVSEAERAVVENVRRKEEAAAVLASNLLHHMTEFERQEVGAA